LTTGNGVRAPALPALRSKVIARRGDFDSLLSGFARLKAVSYVASPESLIALLDKLGLESIDLIAGDGHLAGMYRDTLQSKGVDFAMRLLDLVESGRLRIHIPGRTLHTKLYVLERADSMRLVQTSANLTENARQAGQVNYAWYLDVDADHPFAAAVLKDYEAHLRDSSLFMGDLLDLLRRDSGERREIVEAWIQGKVSADDDAAAVMIFQDLSRQVLLQGGAEEEPIITVRLPEEERTRREAERLLAPLDAAIDRGEATVNGMSFVRHATQVTGLPLLQVDYDRRGVKLALNGSIHSLTGPLPAGTILAEDLAHIESYINTVDSGETGDRLFAKTAMFEALLYVLWSPFAAGYMHARRTRYGLIDSRGPRFLYLFGPAQNGKTTFLRFALKLLTGQLVDPLRDNVFTKSRVRASTSVGTSFPLVFDDLTPSKDFKKFEEIVKSYWESWWQPGYVFPQMIFSSNTENLPEWAKSRVKHIDFDVHFAPDEKARSNLNEIFSRPNNLFPSFAALYLDGVQSSGEFYDDELKLARAAMQRLYEHAGCELPPFFPREPLESLFDPGQRRWRDLIYRMQMAKVRRERDRVYVDFAEAMQYREVQAYQAYLPQTIKNRLRGKTLIIDSRSSFDAWLDRKTGIDRQSHRRWLRMFGRRPER
jgi:hypothetical protein